MNESHLLQIALISTAIGILLLFIISRNIELSETTIEKISNGEITGTVILEGTVKEVRSSENMVSFVLLQNKSIEIVGYSNKIAISNGQKIRVTGKVSEYNNKKNIVADKIEILS